MKKALLIPLLVIFAIACSTDDNTSEEVETLSENKLFNDWKIKSIVDTDGITYDINTPGIDITVFNSLTFKLTKNGTYTWGWDADGAWNKNGNYLLPSDNQIIFQKMIKSDDSNVDATYKFSLNDLILDFNFNGDDIDYFVFEVK